MTQVRRQWEAADSTLRTAGDLGLAIAGEMSHTYTESLRMIERWVQSTDVEFFDRLSGDDTNIDSAAAEIRSMLAITGEFPTSLTAFQHARLVTSDRSWFPEVTQSDADGEGGPAALAQTQTIRGGQDKLDSIFAAIRADMDLLMLQSMGRQQRAAEDQQRASIELQDKLAKVTALLLVPTLIAGIFGANTMLPGEQRWWGFGLMVVLMLASSVIVYIAIRPGPRRRTAAPSQGE
jgi:Mg2+ and Co2+ transporter CorA